jgi:hypothetical protein
LIQSLEDYRVIGIVGNAKNAGKTTVLNALIEAYKEPLILTSIGLDGEAIDQVTFLEKPQVYVRENDIVISAKDTLKQWTAQYEIIEETSIFTAIGPVVISKITYPGKVLIAGPSLVEDMKKIMDHMGEEYTYPMLVDGAFSRSSFGVITDALIYVVGANQHVQMQTTIQNAYNEYHKLTLGPVPNQYMKSIHLNQITIIKKNQVLHLSKSSLIGCEQTVFDMVDECVQAIYIPKALTDQFISKWSKSYHQYQFDIIVHTGIHIQLSQANLNKLFKLSHHIYALKPLNLVAVCINPISPQGYQYDAKEFRDLLSEKLHIKVINVKEGEHNE